MVADDFAYIRKRMYEIAVDKDTARFWANLEYTWFYNTALPQHTFTFDEIDDLEVLMDCPPRHVDLTKPVEPLREGALEIYQITHWDKEDKDMT